MYWLLSEQFFFNQTISYCICLLSKYEDTLSITSFIRAPETGILQITRYCMLLLQVIEIGNLHETAHKHQNELDS